MMITSAFQVSLATKSKERIDFKVEILKKYVQLILPVWIASSITYFAKSTFLNTQFNPDYLVI